jgi:putative ABC transport system permease protein
MTAQIAFRNFTRNGRRYLLLGLAVAAGFFVVSSLQGLIGGLSHQINVRGARYYGGHVIISRAKGNADDASLQEQDRIIERAISTSGVRPLAISHRTHLGGSGVVFFNGESVTMRRVIGMDWSAEGPMIRRLQMVEGDPSGMSDPAGVMMSEVTARRLGVRVGDQVILQVERDAGAVNTVPLWVKAIFREASIFGFYTLYVDRQVLDQALGFDPGYSATIGVYLHDERDADRAAAAIDKALNGQFEAAPLLSFMGELHTLLEALAFVSYGVLGLLAVVIAVGILNLYRVLIYERVREIGTMRAIGVQRRQVRALILWEAVYLAAIGIAAGFIASVVVLWGLSLVPLRASAGLDIFLNRGHLSWVLNADTLVGDALIIGAMVVVGAISPAQAAQQTDPVVSLRTE